MNWELPKHGVPGTSPGVEHQHIALRLIPAGVRQIGHQVVRLGVNNEKMPPGLMPLEGVHV